MLPAGERIAIVIERLPAARADGALTNARAVSSSPIAQIRRTRRSVRTGGEQRLSSQFRDDPRTRMTTSLRSVGRLGSTPNT
jgi:hypothetical protein